MLINSAMFACQRQDYFTELLASGMSEEEAMRHEQANALQRFRNRDAYMDPPTTTTEGEDR